MPAVVEPFVGFEGGKVSRVERAPPFSSLRSVVRVGLGAADSAAVFAGDTDFLVLGGAGFVA